MFREGKDIEGTWNTKEVWSAVSDVTKGRTQRAEILEEKIEHQVNTNHWDE